MMPGVPTPSMTEATSECTGFMEAITLMSAMAKLVLNNKAEKANPNTRMTALHVMLFSYNTGVMI
jgi:hypothetical protein